MKDPKFLNEAAEQFLGRSEEDIKTAIDQTLEGHLRLAIGCKLLSVNLDFKSHSGHFNS